jgi:vancomycin resistance protein YoaR
LCVCLLSTPGKKSAEITMKTSYIPAMAACFLLLSEGGAARASNSDPLAAKVRLTDGHTAITRTRRELGFSLVSDKAPVRFHADLASLKAALTRIAPDFHRPAAEPRPFDYKGAVMVKPGSDAQELNVPTTAAKIVHVIETDPGMMRFDVVVEKHGPKFDAARFKGIDGVLASFSTRTNANPKRNHNVALAASSIDGTLLSPGEVFSLNDTVGKRTHATGFLTAPVFVNAELVPGIGGGVSQITGTLFNAVARAGLKILEVHPHSRPVAYLPLGYDATVAFGEEDLKFKNSTAAPVFIEYRFTPKTRHLTATIFGKKSPGRTVQLRADVRNLAPGKVDADLYRITREGGAVVSKERLFHHHYRWDPTKKE